VSKVLTVVRKEYLERVRSRSFLIGTVLGPVIMATLILGPALLATRAGDEEREVGVIDLSGQTFEPLGAALTSLGRENVDLVPIACTGEPLEECTTRLKDMVLGGALFGGIVIPADFLENPAVVFYNTSVSATVLKDEALRPALNQVLREARFDAAGIDPSIHEYLMARTDWTSIAISAGQEAERDEAVTFAMAFVLIFIIYMMVLLYGNHTLTAVIEEKGSRMVEILLSSLQPEQLMLGKVLGIGLAGLTQFGIWTLAFLALSSQGVSVGGFQIDVSFLTPMILGAFFVFFLLGFFFYATLYAGIGAMCNSVQDAQQFNSIVTMGIIIPMVMISFVLRAPDSTLSTVLSLFPPFAPVLMFMRVCVQTPPVWQIGLSWVLLLLAILAANRMSGKLFRAGILLYGTSPTWGSLVRSLRS